MWARVSLPLLSLRQDFLARRTSKGRSSIMGRAFRTWRRSMTARRALEARVSTPIALLSAGGNLDEPPAQADWLAERNTRQLAGRCLRAWIAASARRAVAAKLVVVRVRRLLLTVRGTRRRFAAEPAG